MIAPALRWAESGLMALTGPERGAPLVPAFDAMSGIDELMDALRSSARALGTALELDESVLSGRAQLMGLRRGGVQSCNRSCRLLEVRDGWVALNLPRPADIELLPAWLGVEVGTDHWRAVERTVRRYDRAALAAMADGLPLALAALPGPGEMATAASAPALSHLPPQPARAGRSLRPVVIDLSALWAGPLCAQLLQQAGARVIKVESAKRLEPARQHWPAFFDQLNAGKESLVLDFDSPSDRSRLRRLIETADMVVSSARPRALEQLDLDPAERFRDRPELIWIAITAHGWYGAARERVGFGDDAGVAAGLVAVGEDGRPAFMGDALADPLTGLSAATVALRAYLHGAAGLHDISLRGCAERIARARRLAPAERGHVQRCGEDWSVRVDGLNRPVSPPRALPDRPARAAPAGAHTQRILQEIAQRS